MKVIYVMALILIAVAVLMTFAHYILSAAYAVAQPIMAAWVDTIQDTMQTAQGYAVFKLTEGMYRQ